MVARVIVGTRTPQLGTAALVAPLRSVLEEGLRAGSFPNAQVDLDIHTIRAITMEVVGWARTGCVRLTRRQAADHILRFCQGALGAPESRSS
jgi:hypothetical protein